MNVPIEFAHPSVLLALWALPLVLALAWFAARQTGAGAAPTLRLVLYGAGSLMLGAGFVVAMSALRLI